MHESPSHIDLDNELIEKPPETYEELKEYMRKKLKQGINTLNLRKESPYCSSQISSMILHSHIKLCVWWFEEIYCFSPVDYKPPEKRENNITQSFCSEDQLDEPSKRKRSRLVTEVEGDASSPCMLE
jgi:hypothetical protein